MTRFEIEGMEELINRLTQVENALDEVVDKALNEVGDNVKEEMKSLVKVSDINHKHIKDDITITDIKGTGKDKYLDVGPGKDTSWRAKFLEFGTVKMSAEPFIQTAHVNTKRENMEIIKRKITEAL